MQAVKSKSVIVYTQPDCPACDWTKAFLSSKGVAFEVRDISIDGQALEQLLSQYQSRSTPTIILGDHVMIGFDPQKLEVILAASENRNGH